MLIEFYESHFEIFLVTSWVSLCKMRKLMCCYFKAIRYLCWRKIEEHFFLKIPACARVRRWRNFELGGVKMGRDIWKDYALRTTKGVEFTDQFRTLTHIILCLPLRLFSKFVFSFNLLDAVENIFKSKESVKKILWSCSNCSNSYSWNQFPLFLKIVLHSVAKCRSKKKILL